MRYFHIGLSCLAWLLGAASPSKGETVRIFFDPAAPQSAFAADDIAIALQARNFTVAKGPLSDIASAAADKKIVIALASDASAKSILAAQGGTAVPALGEQAYALRTTSQGQTAYWALGGDADGAMYGGLQLAENIRFGGMAGTFNTQESPYLKKRGIKFNLPMDARSPAYFGNGFSATDFNGTAFQNSIPHVWDLAFWKDWLDEMARHRYNVLSLWTLHPFTAMISLPDYPDVALQDVKGFNGYSKAMSIDQKIAFWKQVMAHARARGFEFYVVDWNIYNYGATGKYGIDNSPANAATKTYTRKCMTRMLETYPDLAGFGVTSGENMGGLSDADQEKWMWATYGQGMYDYARLHPERKLTFVHRFHQTGGPDVVDNFKPLRDLPNMQFDMSYKYSQAHMYAAPAPTYITTIDGNILAELDKYRLRTWLEVRNEDFFMLHWGDPVFARAYIAALPDKERYLQGIFIGSDGYTNTRVFASKDAVYKGDLEIRRLWYTQMLWGRLAYNPQTPDQVFMDRMAWKYPGMSSTTLFNAWSKSSRAVPLFTELVQGTWRLDYHWWPEACLSNSGFRTIDNMADVKPANGSALCSIANTAAGKCGSARTAYKVADEMEAASQEALDLIGTSTGGTQAELALNIRNIRALSYLGLYYAEKLRGAAYKLAGQTVPAREAMGKADCDWKNYAVLMDLMYTGMKMQRVDDLANWHAMDASVLAEYTKLGGAAGHACQIATGLDEAAAEPRPGPALYSLSSRALTVYLPGETGYSISIHSLAGARLGGLSAGRNAKGYQRIALDSPLAPGVYLVRLSSGGRSLAKRMNILADL